MGEAQITMTVRVVVRDPALLIAAARRALVFDGRSERDAQKAVEEDDSQAALKYVLFPMQDIIPGVDILDVCSELTADTSSQSDTRRVP